MGRGAALGAGVAALAALWRARQLAQAADGKQPGSQFEPHDGDDVFPTGQRLVGDPERLEAKRQALRDAGPRHLRVVLDFDATMSTFWAPGSGPSAGQGKSRNRSCHNVLESFAELPAASRERMAALAAKYFPLEISSKISREQKLRYMVEWVEKSHAELVGSGFRREQLPRAVAAAGVRLREGLAHFLRRLERAGVPVLVFSAGVADVLEEVLRQNDLLLDNIVVVSNRMRFDASGRLVGFEAEAQGREPFHVLNKRFATLPPDEQQAIGWADDQPDQVCVLLAGDSLGDTHMSEGMLPEGAGAARELRVGFLNHHIQTRQAEFAAHFDLVVVNDGDFGALNEVIASVLSAA